MRTFDGLRPVAMDPVTIALFDGLVSAGFPSPAADFTEGAIDLNEILVPHPSATFTLRVSGHSLNRAGIMDQCLLLVDRSLAPRHGSIVVAVLDGELTAKRLTYRHGRVFLEPDSDDPAYKPIDVTGCPGFEIWGVVSANINFHRKA